MSTGLVYYKHGVLEGRGYMAAILLRHLFIIDFYSFIHFFLVVVG